MRDIMVKLSAFEGPLDLLYHLIEKNKIDIYDIPIAVLTDQYLEYLNGEPHKDMDTMSRFIVMAASLLEIKSKMMLPQTLHVEEEDPREQLVAKLLEYKKYKQIIRTFQMREAEAKKIFYRISPYALPENKENSLDMDQVLRSITLQDIYKAFQEVINRREMKIDKVRSDFDSIDRDLYTVEDKIVYINDLLVLTPVLRFKDIFRPNSAKMEWVVTFLALLELAKAKQVQLKQKSIFDDIIITKRNGSD